MFAQTSVDHKAYYEFVFKLFEPYCTADMKSYLKTWTDKRNGKVYQSLSFATMALPCFNIFRESFYPNLPPEAQLISPRGGNGKKIVPVNIDELLTDISLAHWIMDDGSKQGKGIHLNVYAFSEEDIKRLTDTLSNKFGLKCSVHTPKNKPRIYLKAESMIQLRSETSYASFDVLQN